ncbi:MAG: hypothetical protein GF398_08800 [Chitinivibrionales bacterium]|nr:hypothetical protein [Chitinivibrionales bacterium]
MHTNCLLKIGLFAVFVCIDLNAALKAVVVNPYADVSWAACGRYKANLHTHTTESDGNMSPGEVIDAYAGAGCKVLALTDHNKNTWPWSSWGRTPSGVGMIGISGCEASIHDHLNTLYSDYNGSRPTIEASITQAANDGGLAQINHPGRYNRSVSWYVNLFEQYDNLFGIEVYNQGDRYSGDRELWDDILSRMMPQRPVWGTSNDDLHRISHLGRNWQVLLTPGGRLDSVSIRGAIVKGAFYACYDMSGNGADVVELDSFEVARGAVRVFAHCAGDSIHWISDGVDIHQGGEIALSHASLGSYLRAVIYGNNGARTLTQPIGLDKTVGIAPSPVLTSRSPSVLVRQHSYGAVQVRSTASSDPILLEFFDLSGRLAGSAKLPNSTCAASVPLETSNSALIVRLHTGGHRVVSEIIALR